MNNRKSILMLILLVFTLVNVSVNSVMAYLADGDIAHNKITVGGSNITIDEEFDPEPIIPGAVITKKVRIKNEGPNNCYVRVRALFTDSDVGKYASIDWNLSDWEYDAADEYYYYKSVVNVGKTTSYLMTEITIENDIPENMIKDVDLIVYAESYQADGYSDYKEAWADYQKNDK